MVKQKKHKKRNKTKTPFYKWHRWKYRNTFILIISLIIFFWLTTTPLVDNIIKHVGSLGYLGAFITGVLSVSTYTVAPSLVILFHLADILHPIEIAILAGLGAMFGDYVVFHFLKDRVFEELLPLIQKIGKGKIKNLFKSPYFVWLTPMLGAILIASPLPDEIGLGVLGLSKIKKWQFFLLSFTLNTVGIFLIVLAARL